jgi:hypothetical protein
VKANDLSFNQFNQAFAAGHFYQGFTDLDHAWSFTITAAQGG